MQPISKAEERYHEEVAALRTSVTEAETACVTAQRAFTKANDKWWTQAKKNFDGEPTAKELELRDQRDRQMTAWQRAERRLVIAKERLRQLDSPAAMQRFIEQREAQERSLQELHDRKREERGERPVAPKRELDEELQGRVVAMVLDQGLGISKVSKLLNEEGVLPPGRATTWYAATVFQVFKKATGKSVSQARAEVQ